LCRHPLVVDERKSQQDVPNGAAIGAGKHFDFG
jgi:hypothetical protein